MYMDGQDEMQRAWLAINQLVSDFAYSIDMENGERTAELFTEGNWSGPGNGRVRFRGGVGLLAAG
jgi:hypothetical protein